MKETNEDASDKEQKRVARLQDYTVLDRYNLSGTFQHVANMAARIFNVPMAFVNFVDHEKVLIKASIGVDEVSSVSKEIGLCSLAVLCDEVTVFENTRSERSLANNPMVHGMFGLQFYAGAPIRTPDGYNIGVVAIADKRPRRFSKEDEQLLENLASIVIDEIEERSHL